MAAVPEVKADNFANNTRVGGNCKIEQSFIQQIHYNHTYKISLKHSNDSDNNGIIITFLTMMNPKLDLDVTIILLD